nr:hypothetical protein [Sphingomonas guangdongensis]
MAPVECAVSSLPDIPTELDRSYFYHRAKTQIELAERAESEDAVAAHLAMAERYLELCDAERMIADTRAGR